MKNKKTICAILFGVLLLVLSTNTFAKQKYFYTTKSISAIDKDDIEIVRKALTSSSVYYLKKHWIVFKGKKADVYIERDTFKGAKNLLNDGVGTKAVTRGLNVGSKSLYYTRVFQKKSGSHIYTVLACYNVYSSNNKSSITIKETLCDAVTFDCYIKAWYDPSGYNTLSKHAGITYGKVSTSFRVDAKKGNPYDFEKGCKAHGGSFQNFVVEGRGTKDKKYSFWDCVKIGAEYAKVCSKLIPAIKIGSLFNLGNLAKDGVRILNGLKKSSNVYRTDGKQVLSNDRKLIYTINMRMPIQLTNIGDYVQLVIETDPNHHASSWEGSVLNVY